MVPAVGEQRREQCTGGGGEDDGGETGRCRKAAGEQDSTEDGSGCQHSGSGAVDVATGIALDRDIEACDDREQLRGGDDAGKHGQQQERVPADRCQQDAGDRELP